MGEARRGPRSQLRGSVADAVLVCAQVVVFGGSGFVGQSICRAALKLGAEVVSVNRSGAPVGKEWASDVRWIRGDIFEPENYAEEVSKEGRRRPRCPWVGEHTSASS